MSYCIGERLTPRSNINCFVCVCARARSKGMFNKHESLPGSLPLIATQQTRSVSHTAVPGTGEESRSLGLHGPHLAY